MHIYFSMGDRGTTYVLRIGRLNRNDEVEIVDTRCLDGPDPAGSQFLPFFEHAWNLCRENDMCYLLASSAQGFRRDGYSIAPDDLRVQYARVEKRDGVLTEDFRNGTTIEAKFDPSILLLQRAEK
ncbi:MAG: hypothetical protein P1U53_11125 [Sulfitobacter sp.]|nr:hypothetical protein [Sulfitobacter sp.]